MRARSPMGPVLLLYPLYLAVLALLYGAWPGSPDQYELDYLGWRLLAGDAPYVDWIDVNWPGTFWLHQLSVWALGNRLHGWRIFDFLLMLAGLAFLVDWLRRAWGPEAAAWAAGLYPALYVTAYGPWFSGQPDIDAAHLLLPALWCHWRAWQTRRPLRQLGTGLAAMAALLVKPVVAPLLPLLMLHGWLLAGRGPGRGRAVVQHAVVSALAAALGLVAALGLLLAQGATLRSIWELAILANAPGHRAPPGPTRLWEIARLAHVHAWHWISAGAVLSLAWALRSARTPEALGRVTLLPLMWGVGWLAYVWQDRGYQYHLGICFVAMTAVLFTGLGALTARLRAGLSPPLRVLALAALGLPLLGTAVKLVNSHGGSARWLLGWQSSAQHYARFEAGDGLDVAEALALVPEVLRQVPEGQPLLVWGEATVVNFLSARPQPTRFYYPPILWSVQVPAALQERWNGWLRADLEARTAPLALIPHQNLDVSYVGPALGDFLGAYLARSYDEIERIGDVGVFRRHEKDR